MEGHRLPPPPKKDVMNRIQSWIEDSSTAHKFKDPIFPRESEIEHSDQYHEEQITRVSGSRQIQYDARNELNKLRKDRCQWDHQNFDGPLEFDRNSETHHSFRGSRFSTPFQVETPFNPKIIGSNPEDFTKYYDYGDLQEEAINQGYIMYSIEKPKPERVRKYKRAESSEEPGIDNKPEDELGPETTKIYHQPIPGFGFDLMDKDQLFHKSVSNDRLYVQKPTNSNWDSKKYENHFKYQASAPRRLDHWDKNFDVNPSNFGRNNNRISSEAVPGPDAINNEMEDKYSFKSRCPINERLVKMSPNEDPAWPRTNECQTHGPRGSKTLEHLQKQFEPSLQMNYMPQTPLRNQSQPQPSGSKAPYHQGEGPNLKMYDHPERFDENPSKSYIKPMSGSNKRWENLGWESDDMEETFDFNLHSEFKNFSLDRSKGDEGWGTKDLKPNMKDNNLGSGVTPSLNEAWTKKDQSSFNNHWDNATRQNRSNEKSGSLEKAWQQPSWDNKSRQASKMCNQWDDIEHQFNSNENSTRAYNQVNSSWENTGARNSKHLNHSSKNKPEAHEDYNAKHSEKEVKQTTTWSKKEVYFNNNISPNWDNGDQNHNYEPEEINGLRRNQFLPEFEKNNLPEPDSIKNDNQGNKFGFKKAAIGGWDDESEQNTSPFDKNPKTRQDQGFDQRTARKDFTLEPSSSRSSTLSKLGAQKATEPDQQGRTEPYFHPDAYQSSETKSFDGENYIQFEEEPPHPAKVYSKKPTAGWDTDDEEASQRSYRSFSRAPLGPIPQSRNHRSSSSHNRNVPIEYPEWSAEHHTHLSDKNQRMSSENWQAVKSQQLAEWYQRDQRFKAKNPVKAHAIWNQESSMSINDNTLTTEASLAIDLVGNQAFRVTKNYI